MQVIQELIGVRGHLALDDLALVLDDLALVLGHLPGGVLVRTPPGRVHFFFFRLSERLCSPSMEYTIQ